MSGGRTKQRWAGDWSKIESDFYLMVEESQLALAGFVANKLNAGISPSAIADLLKYEADRMRIWCAGQDGAA